MKEADVTLERSILMALLEAIISVVVFVEQCLRCCIAVLNLWIDRWMGRWLNRCDVILGRNIKAMLVLIKRPDGPGGLR